MKITDLRCEYFSQPLGLEAARPRLFWRLETDRSGARQIAYRITTDNGWDSGRVESDRTTHIEYDGPALASRQRVEWQVEVWDETGQSARSESASWEMGLLEPGDWRGQWIGGALVGGPENAVPAPFLRRAFALDKPVKAARLYATAMGLYECEINGHRVGDHVFAPGWTDYFQRLHYQTFDVTELVQNGDNAWGAVLGDGWACGRIAWKARQNYADAPHFLGQLEIEFEDGTHEIIASDADWKAAYGPILSNDLLTGENHDARLELDGWSAPDFADESWQTVRVFEAPAAQICAPLAAPVVETQVLEPVAKHQHGGAWIFDMGQNMVGRPRLRVSGERGQSLRLRFAETLQGGPAATDGPIYTENLRSAQQTDVYTLRGEGVEEWEPRFTFHGFRFVEVVGLSGEPAPDFLSGVVLHSRAPQTGDFACSDELVNQLQRNIDWGWRGNSLDVPTDCPQRDERMGWTGDAQVFAPTSCFLRDVAGFWSEWARDVADAQKEDGAIPATVPVPGQSIQAGHDAWHDGGPAWADAVLICPWTIYNCYGDTRILRENYPVFQKFMGYLEATSREGLRCYEGAPYFPGFGDWLALDGSGQTEGGTPKDLIGTAFFAHAADLMSRIADVLGETDDAARYRELFERVKAVFARRFVTPDGRLSPPYQTPYVLALHFDLLPEAARENAVAELKQEIANRGGKLSTGFVGTSYLPFVLSENGALESAYQLLLQRDWPSYLYAVTQGATTIWERWDGWTREQGFQSAGMNSFNHYAYGAVGDWMVQVVAGIRPDAQAPGYKKFVLQPRPSDGLSWARAHLDTLHGRIESEWKIEDGQFSYRFAVPPNTSATLILPDGETREVAAGVHEGQCAL